MTSAADYDLMIGRCQAAAAQCRSPRKTPGEAGAGRSEAEIKQPSQSKPRAPEIRYLGFRTSDDGRKYALRARCESSEDRLFLFLIPHEAFSARLASYQDGPDLCSQKLRSELAADPGLWPGGPLVLSEKDLLDYREAHRPPSARRKNRGPGSGAEGDGVGQSDR